MENIKCPKCGNEFEIEAALQSSVETKLKAEYNLKFKELSEKNKLEAERKAKEELEKEKNNLKAELENQQKTLKEKELALKAKIEAENAEKQRFMEEELSTKAKQLAEAKQKELEFLKKQRELEEQKQEFEITLQKKLFEEQKKIEETLREKVETENMLKLKEKDKKIEQMMEQLEIAKQKANQGLTQLQGEVQEIALEELLRQHFPFDVVEEVPKGVTGADCFLNIRNSLGAHCGQIIFESKRTKDFQNGWIEKLKSDQRNQKSDIAVLITQTLPKDITNFGLKDGIWISSFEHIKGLVAVLRESIIKINEAQSAEENKGDKAIMIYNYLTSNDFKVRIENMVEGLADLKKNLDQEKRQMAKIWAEREKQMEKVIGNTLSLFGSIRGIAGSNTISDIKILELEE